MKLNWGLIGCGDISRKRVAPALRDLESCRFIGVSRAKKELARSFAQEFGAEKWYGDYRELLQDKNIQAVYIATPPFLHAEQVVGAAEAGKHIICEKPMAMNTILTENGERDENFPPHVNFHQPYIEAVTAAILTDSELPVSGETGRVVAQLEEEIYGVQEI